MKEIENILTSTKSFVLCQVRADKNVLTNPLEYVLGDFNIAELDNFNNIEEIIANLNPNSETSEGIGHVKYCEGVKDSIIECYENGKDATISLAFLNNATFIAQFKKDEDKLNIVFFYLRTSNIDKLAASKYKDQLTGLFNKATMLKHLSEKSDDGYLCLFDLDKFKVINDTFGHQVGDEVLQLLSSYLISISSIEEIFYRIGGDEFVILFLTTDLTIIFNVVNHIQKYLEELHEGPLKRYKGLKCGASFGLLEIRYPKQEKAISPDVQFKLADLAMYQAKRASKTYHLISYEDSKLIIKSGELDSRLQKLSVSKNRY